MIFDTVSLAPEVTLVQKGPLATMETWSSVLRANSASWDLPLRQVPSNVQPVHSPLLRRRCLSKTVCPAHLASTVSNLIQLKRPLAQLATTVLSVPSHPLNTLAPKVPTALRLDLLIKINALHAVLATTVPTLQCKPRLLALPVIITTMTFKHYGVTCALPVTLVTQMLTRSLVQRVTTRTEALLVALVVNWVISAQSRALQRCR